MVIKALERDQFVVSSLLDYAMVVDHQHQVGLANRTQSVGDHKGGAPFQQMQHRILNIYLGARVNAARRLIQNQNAWVCQHRTRNSQQLTLTMTEIVPCSETIVW